MFDGFAETPLQSMVAASSAGLGARPILCLLHGFPETHLMWRMLVTARRHFTTVAATCLARRHDCPPDADDSRPSSKRGMAHNDRGEKSWGWNGSPSLVTIAADAWLIHGADRPDCMTAVAVLDVIQSPRLALADSRLRWHSAVVAARPARRYPNR